MVTDWWKTSYKLSKSLEEESPGAAACAAKLREETTVGVMSYVISQ
jgi:hypothetical protein